MNRAMSIEEQVYIREQNEQKRRSKEIADAQEFNAFASTYEGRRLLRRFIDECGVYRQTFTGDPLSSAFQEGRRSIGLWLIELFDSCPDLYIQLLTEKEQ